MGINQIILIVMAGFAVLGAADRMAGNRIGLGEKFEEGFMAMGPLALSMTGFLVLAPVVARILGPVITPLFQAVHADPSLFAGIFLAIDMGGASLAEQMAQVPGAAQFSGILVGSMLGATIVFNIPVAMELAGEERQFIARGTLVGLVTIPAGCLVGGILQGLSIGFVLCNLIPVAVIAVLIAAGLWKWQEKMIRGFMIFAKIVVILSTAALGLAIWQTQTGIVLLSHLGSLQGALKIVANVSIVLAGAFPLVHVITRLLSRPLKRLGDLLGMNETSAGGMLLSMANSIPMLRSMQNMDERGKVINAAFAVSGAFVFGDHLGFTAGFAPEMLVPMILGKLMAGILAVLLAIWLTRPAAERAGNR